MTMPNFLVIGEARCGTTALYHCLKQHPQIYMSPVKEPKFFAYEGEELDFRGPGDMKAHRTAITDLESYRALFNGVADERAVGEVSPVYLYSHKAPERIGHHIPDSKLIAILRHPAERAYSSFLKLVRDNREPLTDFAQALEQEPQRIRDNWEPFWFYKLRGFYSGNVERYFEFFGRERVRIYLHDDYIADPVGLFQDIFRFLGVDHTFVPDVSRQRNLSGVPKSRVLDAFLRDPNPIKSALTPLLPAGLRGRLSKSLKSKNLVKPPFPPEVRKQLIDEYRPDILKLQELINKDLSQWLQ